jgi:hypothetical protein
MLESLKNHRWMNLFVIHLRYAAGYVLIASGLTRIIGVCTVWSSTSTPSFFYSSIINSSLGWLQIAVALLLMTQRYASWGTVVFLAIALNGWISLLPDFNGTWMLATMMLMSAVFLTVWDFENIKRTFSIQARECTYQPPRVWMFFGIFLFVISVVTNLFMHYSSSGFACAVYMLSALILVMLVQFAVFIKDQHDFQNAGTFT